QSLLFGGLQLLLHTTLILAAGLLIAQIVRRKSAAAESTALRGTLIASIATPLVAGLVAASGMAGLRVQIPDALALTYAGDPQVKTDITSSDGEFTSSAKPATASSEIPAQSESIAADGSPSAAATGWPDERPSLDSVMPIVPVGSWVTTGTLVAVAL